MHILFIYTYTENADNKSHVIYVFFEMAFYPFLGAYASI